MYMLSGLGDSCTDTVRAVWAQCLHTCGCSDDLMHCTDVSMDCVESCNTVANIGITDCGGSADSWQPSITFDLPSGTTPTTPGTMPKGLPPPPGGTPGAPVNWWRIGAAVAIGVVGLGIVLGLRRAVGGAGHAA